MLQVLTVGLSAFLIFNLQPMISKIILPFFGGSSYIWITCLIFFSRDLNAHLYNMTKIDELVKSQTSTAK